jgi:Holliday junction resolvase RusA-like endonuclease
MTACLKCGHDPHATVTASWTFHVPREIKSGNAHVFNVGASRFAYKRERTDWYADFRALKMALRIPNASDKRRVTLTRYIGYRQRAFDRDNLATGFKACVDAMVMANLLVNDNAAGAEIHYAQTKREGWSGVQVEIEELGESKVLSTGSQQPGKRRANEH